MVQGGKRGEGCSRGELQNFKVLNRFLDLADLDLSRTEHLLVVTSIVLRETFLGTPQQAEGWQSVSNRRSETRAEKNISDC